MQKKVLAEQALYYGDVSMPKGFEIDSDKLTNSILQSSIQNKELPFTKTWDMLNTYIREHIKLEHDLSVANKLTWGNIFKPNETTAPLLNIDPVDLRNSPDFVLLYGIKVDNCSVRIHYDDNKRKGKSWDIPIINNKFIMFPSMCMYYLTNKQKDSLNFVQTITYERI
jgi:hypothetical protein|tara:strand:- start:1929 stop:2432 length:504 start_codon:yes stop_codon:yes gene_type:complete